MQFQTPMLARVQTRRCPNTPPIPGLARLDISPKRVLIVGDIHGCYDRLDEALADLKFDANQDILVSVGDLVDRGPLSERCLSFLSSPGVYAVRGNHEQMILDSHANPDGDELAGYVIGNGGYWYAMLEPDQRDAVAAAFHKLPLALEFTTASGRTIGVTHADAPHDWTLLRTLADGDILTDQRLEQIIWSRDNFDDAVRANHLGVSPHDFPCVAHIDHVFHGHSILRKPLTMGNRSWIDTGAFRSGILTVIDIDEYLDGIR